MICEYGSGLKVEYSGSLSITKEDQIDVFIKEGSIPGFYKSELDTAARHNSCDELWEVGRKITDRIGYDAHID